MAEDKNININVTANVNGQNQKPGGGIPSIQSVNAQRANKATVQVMQAAQKHSDVNKPSDNKPSGQITTENTEVALNLKNILKVLTQFVDDQKITSKTQTDAIADLSNNVKSLAPTEKTGIKEGPSQIVISDFSVEALQKYKSAIGSSLNESLSVSNGTLVTNLSEELGSYAGNSETSLTINSEDISKFKESVNLFKTTLDYSIQSKNGEIDASEALERAKLTNEYLKALSESSPNLLQATKELTSKMEESVDINKLTEYTGDIETTAFNRSLFEDIASRKTDEMSKAIEEGVSQILNSKQVSQMSEELYSYIEDSIKSRQVSLSVQNSLAEKIETSIIRNVEESAREKDISINTEKIEESIAKGNQKTISVNNANPLGNSDVLDKNKDRTGLLVSQNNLLGEMSSANADSLKKSNEKPIGELSSGGNYVLKSSTNLSGKSTNANLIDAMVSMKSTIAKDQMTPISNLMERDYVQNGKSLNTLYEILGVFRAFSKNYAQIAQDAKERQEYLDSFTVEKEEKKADTIISVKAGDSKKTTEKKKEEGGGLMSWLMGIIGAIFLGKKGLMGFLWGAIKGVFKWVGKGLWTAMKWVAKGAWQVFKWLGKGIWSGIKWVGKWLGKGIGKVWGFLKGGISKIFSGIGKFFGKLIPNCLKNLGGLFKNMFGKLGSMISKASQGIMKGVKGIGKGFSSLVKGVGKAGKVVAKGAGGIIKGGAKILTKGTGALFKGGSKVLGGATKLLAKGGLKAAAKVGAGALKAIPGVGLIATAGMAAVDAIDGWKNAAAISGKRAEDVTTADKVKAAGASALSGLTFGLVSSKTMYKGISAVTGGVSKVAKGLWGGAKKLLKYSPAGLLASGAKNLFGGGGVSSKETKALTDSMVKLRSSILILARRLLKYTSAGSSIDSFETRSNLPYWWLYRRKEGSETKADTKRTSIDFLKSLDENVLKLVESAEAVMAHFQIKKLSKTKVTISRSSEDGDIVSNNYGNVSSNMQQKSATSTLKNSTVLNTGVRNMSNNTLSSATSLATHQIRLQQLKAAHDTEVGDFQLNDIVASINPSEISNGVLKGMADYFSTYTPTVHTDTRTELKYNIYGGETMSKAVLSPK